MVLQAKMQAIGWEWSRLPTLIAVLLLCFILLHLSLCAAQIWFTGSLVCWTQPFQSISTRDCYCVWFLMISTVHLQSCVSGSQLTSMPSLAASRCRWTWSCSSSSWLGCQSRDRMRSMLRAYMVWEGITPWWTCIRQVEKKVNVPFKILM